MSKSSVRSLSSAQDSRDADDKAPEFRYATNIIGKPFYRIRETHVRDHYVPLIAKNALGAAKLDLALRGIALPPGGTGKRKEGVGLVLPAISYEEIHDLVRTPDHYAKLQKKLYDPDDALHRKQKREWVREQLDKLERLNLIKRTHPVGGGRPKIHVLKDDGSGESFDDPKGGGSNAYFTTLSCVISSGRLRSWTSSEFCFYIAAMIGERHHRYRVDDSSARGCGQWYQAYSWFLDDHNHRPEAHVRIPFSKATLDRGLRSFLGSGLVTKVKERKDPYTGKKFQRGPRNIYTNHFGELSAER
jgi:hypothetical protein